MTTIRYIGATEVVYTTGPLTGPVEPGDEREVQDEDATSLVGTGQWELVAVVVKKTAIAKAEKTTAPDKSGKEDQSQQLQ